ncbi:MAG TPA: aldehyde ferredoxin oxidoreductase family protein [Clostridiales bacterium]|nr:MAG: putative oxidoreductase YdhV [Firmicutes bacterium ADurb.Bin262]HOU11401.1 aldehyde ferredoxin oxidoreductase family protein [Clostridiales bacterium]HQH63026.1 aldehyde ferredoxin oxidoreductase family protein [Clostridiales bacterium]HQK73293.1 aldehyde ferredoxin oxidoreductase family protein [Clostridiales bacterium]
MTKYKGYAGKVLKIDLGKETFEDYPWTDKDRERTIGGKIMAAEILYRHIKPGMTAFDEDNWLVVTTGPLSGCGCPSTSRFNISTVSPLTGIVTSSNCGGNFGLSLKRAGYDAVIFTGKAKKPVHVEIGENAVAFHDASALWGLTVTATQEQLPPKAGKMVIGPAGENKVLYAAVFSGERTAGRGGVGAVFGDKNLKAVTADGNVKIEVFDKEKLKATNKKWVDQLRKHPLTGKQLPKLGTAGLIAPMQAHRILATKNFSTGRFDDFEKVSGEVLAEKYLVKNSGCTTCVIQCTRRVTVDGKVVKGPELETLGLLGPNLMNSNLELINRWNYELDELGMDTISTAGSVAFAMELNEKGLWDNGLKFGEVDNLSQVFEDIAYRRGIGDILAQGTKRMAERFGGKEFAINAKGMELAAYEPRSAVGHGLGYATANRGGCHLNAGYVVVLEGLGLNINQYTPHGKAAIAIFFQNMMECVSAMGSCLFTTYAVLPAPVMARPDWIVTKITNKAFTKIGPIIGLLDMHPWIASMNLPLIMHGPALRDATGMKVNIGMMMKTGERGYNLERQCNIILGQKAGADTLPKRLTDEPQYPENPKSKVPLQKMLKNYYFIRGWKDGVPTKRKLDKLGIH